MLQVVFIGKKKKDYLSTSTYVGSSAVLVCGMISVLGLHMVNRSVILKIRVTQYLLYFFSGFTDLKINFLVWLRVLKSTEKS